MEFLVDLWLPILVGTVGLWFLSFLFWAIQPHHFGDHCQLDDEDAMMQFVRDSNIQPGKLVDGVALGLIFAFLWPA